MSLNAEKIHKQLYRERSSSSVIRSEVEQIRMDKWNWGVPVSPNEVNEDLNNGQSIIQNINTKDSEQKKEQKEDDDQGDESIFSTKSPLKPSQL
ncbi:MAG: hypothetical protein EZS28_040186 [Streblomastix strix]|uniref:Uncharacterized protein n=1 Tax=Streblomastix strix TaxID=222440 RepID=A0A5J4U1Q2_9EUKA|nr:MAG: hypothetical protein EZS28_040186 [Streblomastix strix]